MHAPQTVLDAPFLLNPGDHLPGGGVDIGAQFNLELLSLFLAQSGTRPLIVIWLQQGRQPALTIPLQPFGDLVAPHL